MEKEIWKDIPEFEGSYQASNLGRIKSLARSVMCKNGKINSYHERIMKFRFDKDGYYRLNIGAGNGIKTARVNILVAKAWIPNPENKPEVNHKDGVKTNNHISNLEWVTFSENRYHSFATGLQKPTWKNRKGRLHNCSKPVRQLTKDGSFIKEHESITSAKESVGLKQGSAISFVCMGKRKSAGGYKWEYAQQP